MYYPCSENKGADQLVLGDDLSVLTKMDAVALIAHRLMFASRVEFRQYKQFNPPTGLSPEFGFGPSLPRPAFSVHEHHRTTVQQFISNGSPSDISGINGGNGQYRGMNPAFTPPGQLQNMGHSGRYSPGYQALLPNGRPPAVNLFPSAPAMGGFPRSYSVPGNLSAFESRRLVSYSTRLFSLFS